MAPAARSARRHKRVRELSAEAAVVPDDPKERKSDGVSGGGDRGVASGGSRDEDGSVRPRSASLDGNGRRMIGSKSRRLPSYGQSDDDRRRGLYFARYYREL